MPDHGFAPPPHTGAPAEFYLDAFYLNETAEEASTPDGVAEGILERVLLADGPFQEWFAAKITEDIEAWEGECVREG